MAGSALPEDKIPFLASTGIWDLWGFFVEEMGQISVSSVGWELSSVLALEWEMFNSKIPAVLLEVSRLRALARQPREIKVGITEWFGLEGHSGSSSSPPAMGRDTSPYPRN